MNAFESFSTVLLLCNSIEKLYYFSDELLFRYEHQVLNRIVSLKFLYKRKTDPKSWLIFDYFRSI